MPAGDVHQTALRLLARRALSRQELRERLLRREHPAEAVDRELVRLERVGLIDDRDLARRVCRQELEAGRGLHAVRRRLAQRSVAAEDAGGALAELAPEQEAASLQKALRRAALRYPRFRDDRRDLDRLLRHLVGRGFGLAAVRTALAAVDAGAEGDEWLESGESGG